MINNKFVIIAPMYNASTTLSRMFCSIVGQSYDDWRLILIDDVSDLEHKIRSEKTIEHFKHLDNARCFSKIDVIWNAEKKWETENVLTGIKLCDDNDVILRVDADDWLIDLDAFMILNQVYNHVGCEFAWTMHRWGFSDRNISGPLANDANPYQVDWRTSHLKSFRKYLLNSVHDENFRNQNGDYVKRCGDQALALPALWNTNKRFFIERVMYHYTIDEQGGAVYQTDDAKFQKEESEFLRKRGFVK